MPSSDSEDFESADEGHISPDKKERKKRLSSSNYNDNALEADENLRITLQKSKIESTAPPKKTDGWDDFEIEEETVEPKPSTTEKKNNSSNPQSSTNKKETSKDTGWDDFGDWGEDDGFSKEKAQPVKPMPQESAQPDPDIKSVTDRMAAASTGSWGWGWSVDSLLSTATAGITTLTSQVSQGISTVLESGIGAPDPEELARQRAKEQDSAIENKPDSPSLDAKCDRKETETVENKGNESDAAFPFGSLLSGVTKFVETTGTKVLAGGLDTLETIGKKTMEVLQDGDPGLAKKRAMLGLDPGDKPVLSQILREAKAKAEEEDRIKEAKREAKEVHYENLFDDFEGLVHLEALEMLSRQVSMRIDERLRGADPEKRQDIKETLQQVAELCEMPEEDDEEDEPSDEEKPKADVFHDRLQTATQDLGLKLQFQPLVKQYTELLDWISNNDPSMNETAVYKRAVSCLAQCTALSVEIYHKCAEMLLVKPRRSTADETDALTQMTVVLTKHISELATLFTEKLNSVTSDNKDKINNYITNIFLEAGNSSTYVQNAFQLALPILQIGAV